MRVLHVVGSSKFGGASRVILSLCNMARYNNIEPYVLVSNPENQKYYRKNNIGVVDFKGIDRPIRPWKDFYDTLRLASYLKQNKFDIVHTHTIK